MTSHDQHQKTKENLDSNSLDKEPTNLISGSLIPEHKNNIDDGTNESDSEVEVHVNTYNLKLTFVGNANVGKTSIIYRFCEHKFEPENIISTISVAYNKIKLKVDPFTELDMQVWDTAGQERFRSITRGYLRGSNGIFIVFDLTNKQSYDDVQSWLDEIKNGDVDQDCVRMLIGNKLDADNKEVDVNEVNKFCEENDIKFLTVSAKNGINIDTMFEIMGNACAKIIQEKEKENENDELNNEKNKNEQNISLNIELNEENNNNIDVNKNNSNTKKERCC